MPSKSPAQRRLMQAAAHNPRFAKKAGVPQSVAREYAKADAARTVFGKHRASTTMMAGKKR